MFFNIDVQPTKETAAIRAFELTSTASSNAVAPVDDFVFHLTDKPYSIMSDEELMSLPLGSTFVIDTECYENYFLIALKSMHNDKVLIFEETEGFDGKRINRAKLLWVLSNFATVGFNSRDYDMPLIRVSLQGYSCKFLKGVSNWIIFDGIRPYQVEQKYNLVSVAWNHVDLIEVAPLKGSLKLYAGRLHCQRMQDLPYEHDSILNPEEIERLRQYCVNDLDNTELLMNELEPHLALRAAMSNEYGLDLRSRSDAQIAEYVIGSELTKLHGKKIERPEIPPGKTYYYTPPKFVSYQSQVLKEMLEVVRKSKFVVGDDGSIQMPKEIGDFKINIGSCTYRMGIGGLHSSEKSVCHIAGDDYLLLDRDVASYYPAIILNNELYPKHLGKAFLVVYKTLVDRRLAAKKEAKRLKELGQYAAAKVFEVIADSLKIVINGSFGKLGNRWSILYSPDLLIQVTITGQLCLLMLIDMLESAGISVISANTDGILIKCHKPNKHTVDTVIAQWEQATGFVTEESQYNAVYSRDVNNYIAIKDGKPKVKGAYSEKGSAGNSSLSRNPECFVCIDAVINQLTKSTPLADTIHGCNDIRKFVTVRNVNGGAEKSGQYVGKTVRWYFSTQCKGEIVYRKNGNKVPNSDGAMPLMEMPNQLPVDIDYDRYIAIAEEILIDLGAKPKPPKKRAKAAMAFAFD